MPRQFDRPFTRFLQRIGVQDRGQRLELSDRVQPVAIVGDYADAAPEHQNPLYSVDLFQAAAGAATYAVLEIWARTKAFRLIEAIPFTNVGHLFVSDVAVASTVVDNPDLASLGPTAGGQPDGVCVEGHHTAVLYGDAFIIQANTSFLTPILVAAGQRLVLQSGNLNQDLRAEFIIEELPRSLEMGANVGYPRPGVD